MTYCPSCQAPQFTPAMEAYAAKWGRCEQCDSLAAMRGELTAAQVAEREGRDYAPAAPRKREVAPWNAALAD